MQEDGDRGSGGSHAAIVQRPDGDAELVQQQSQQAQQVQQRPDGDAEVAGGGQGFRVPPCPACGGVLKPHVVFFGDGKRGLETRGSPPAFRKYAWVMVKLCQSRHQTLFY